GTGYRRWLDIVTAEQGQVDGQGEMHVA
ncbi:MAG: hypothetical protein QOE03_3526, partial [Micromonosporaceae bacterium]|nr:hypothetical protein [Micromonosporaceae bacterium]